MDDIEKVQYLIGKGQELLKTINPNSHCVDKKDYYAWRTQCISFIKVSRLPLISRENYSQEFQNLVLGIHHICFSEPHYDNAIETGIELLKSVKEDIGAAPFIEERSNPIDSIINLCERFHLVARQLRSRHNKRCALDVKDEYDVQDLFHALLYLHFEDIRPEEWTPSFAGASSRMDFLLKPEQMIIEIKKTRNNLGAKEVGSQLIEDIGRYQAHPDCRVLICFVYDPEGKIANPKGIESDLSRVEENLTVQVLIRP